MGIFGEKTTASVVQTQNVHEHGESPSSEPSSPGFDAKETKRLVRKIDWHLMPVLSILYLLSFLDRTSVSNARLANLETDLNMKGLNYNVALAILFPFYVAAEIPSNLMMKLTRPSIWLPSTMVAWGLVAALMGLVTSYGGLLVARAALGLAEGGLFPGINFFISMWYRRHECGFRMSIFFSMATAAGAFGGILARGISELNGVGGRGGWAWIFIIEGILTFVIAIGAYFFFNDYPDTAKFITEKERQEIYRRLDQDRNGLADEFDIRYVWQALTDWKIYMHCLNFLGTFTAVYSFSFFLPTIIKDLGYTNNAAQLMTVPPYVVACFFCLSTGYFTDKIQSRGIVLISYSIIAIIGLIMLLTSKSTHVKYAGTFFFATGVYPNVPQCMAWNSNNVGGSTKRSIALAMQAMIGNLGGILSAFIYLKKDGPHYKNGHSIVIGVLCMSILISTFMTSYYRFENKKRDKAGKNLADYTQTEKEAEREKGDSASFFRFTV